MAIYAAIDATNITGAVYSVGKNKSKVIAEALRLGGSTADRADLRIVPITPAAAAYVEEYGGAPSQYLSVSRDGVSLRSEE